ncbi:MAG: MoaD/ThiS family protein [Gemmatimonadaceae bacterium]
MATVQLFASYADMFGARSLEIPLDKTTTVRELVERIRTLPNAVSLPEFPVVAINRTFATTDQLVRVGDEIALIPPVAGG